MEHTGNYASFGKRFLALILDGMIIGAATWVLGGFSGMGNSWGHMYSYGGYGMMQGRWGMNDASGPLKLVLGWLYYAFMESSEHQATLGKIAMDIKVTDMHGHRLTFGRATGRYFAKILSVITLGIGFLMAAFTEKKQALHDIVAKTLVVNK